MARLPSPRSAGLGSIYTISALAGFTGELENTKENFVDYLSI
jgi:hypothetical protein